MVLIQNGDPVTIMLVEDDPGHARLIEKNIRRAGVNNEIVALKTGRDALDHFLGPDRRAVNAHRLLLLLDLNLPDMSGISILQQLKANEHTRRVPVVILTTTDDKREVQRCYELGCNVYVTKPIEYDAFANAIRQLGLFFSIMQVPGAD